MKTSILRFTALMAAAVATSFILSLSAHAQLAPYVWIDDHGVKQFSDQPPPPSVPKNKIIKYSGKAVELQDSDSDSNADTSKPAAKAPESLADKELAYKKRHEEMALKAKKADDEAKAAATKTDNCKRMRDYKAALESGQRIAETDASGSRSYLTDDQRAQQLNTLNQNLGDCGN